MKKYKRIPALAALLALLLALPATAAAGDGSDPLITRSYADGTFRAQLSAALDDLCGRAAQSVRDVEPDGNGWKTLTLSAGDSVTLRDGQQLLLCSGGVRFTIDAGKLVNATQGWESTGGDARPGHLYVAHGGAAVRADCAEGAVVLCSSGAEADVTAPPQPVETPAEGCPFTDVPAGAWYYTDVVNAYTRGLVNGMTPTTYEPGGRLTLAQAVKLAACMHQLDREGAVTLGNAAPPRNWYADYADYALAQGILDALPASGWNAEIDRADFVRLFYRALPAERYGAINIIPLGAIPDVAAEDENAPEIYTFYAAGILTGYAEGDGHAAHAFGAATPISRAEVATIMNRMFDADARVSFAIE